MPFEVAPARDCPDCPFQGCIEDLRQRPVAGRNTTFRINQSKALSCMLGNFVPGSDGDPDPSRTFEFYQAQLQKNFMGAGGQLFGRDFKVERNAIAKVQGDVYQNLQAAVLWNAAAAWNRFMDTGVWPSTAFREPIGAVPTPLRKIAILPLPRGYDTTKLFAPAVRNTIRAHEAALQRRGMELGMSSPDLVGVRIPEPVPISYRPFLQPLGDLGTVSLRTLEHAKDLVEGTLESYQFLLAIAVKRTVRSDRLYQPLFEANVLKYLIQEVLRGGSFRFMVNVESLEGADVRRRYSAPSLLSLLRGADASAAIDKLTVATHPRDMAQSVLDDFPLFPR